MKYKNKAPEDLVSGEASSFLFCHMAEERESEPDTKGHKDTEEEALRHSYEYITLIHNISPQWPSYPFKKSVTSWHKRWEIPTYKFGKVHKTFVCLSRHGSPV